MIVRLLGPVEVWGQAGRVPTGSPQQCLVIAALAVDAGRPVPAELLIDRLWGLEPPPHARRTMHSYVARARRTFGAAAPVTRSIGGYVLELDPHEVDLHVFRRQVALAGEPTCPDAQRVASLREAVGLWRGEPLAGLGGEWAERTRQSWRREHVDAAAAWANAELHAGEPAAVVGPLTELVGEHPLVEPLAAALIRVLATLGHSAEALSLFQSVRRRLANDLGADPGPELQEAHRAVLRGQVEAPVKAPVNVLSAPVPRQLPTPPRSFTGRARELAELESVLAKAGDQRAVPICAVFGPPGVGKTALAIHWAHRVADRFPDGQLYVDLRGFDPSGPAMSAAEAVRVFLDALGVPPQRVPPSLDAQAGLYRSLLATKRVLVVLDNARGVEQVRPLLPGAPDCLVMVTSRSRLTGLLAAEGAHPLTLNLPTPAEAVDLIADRLGRDRVSAEPDAVQEIIVRCGRLPLALAIVAARAVTRPDFPLSTLASELGDNRGGLRSLSGGDAATDVRAVFSCSYQALSPTTARLFRLISLHPGPDIAVPAAASLVGASVIDARSMLAELTGAHLTNEHIPGRYSVHDLLRAYARELTETHDADNEQRAATHRMLDHYLHTAHEAALLLRPQGEPIDLAPTRAGVSPTPLADLGQALAWFTTEHPALLSAVDLAARAGFDTHAWQLTWALADHLDRRGLWGDWTAAQRTAFAAVQRLGDRAGRDYALRRLSTAAAQMGCSSHDDTLFRQAEALHNLATGGAEGGHHGDVETMLRCAITRFGELGDSAGQANAYLLLGGWHKMVGRYADALRHSQKALELYTAAGHRAGRARTLNTAGWFHALLGEYRQALHLCEEALRLFQELGERKGEAHTWDSLGFARHQLGDRTRAVACYLSALDLFRDLGDRVNEAAALTCLGDVHSSTDPDAACGYWWQALEILDQLNDTGADLVRTKLAKL